MTMGQVSSLGAVTVLAAILLTGGAVASSAGPQKDGQIQRGTPISTEALPDPSECTVTPRTPDELRALAPGGHRRRYRPRRPIVVDTVVDEVRAATRVYVACLNTGEDYRVFGILTHNFLRTLPSGDGFLVDDDAALTALATPSPIRWSQLSPMPSLIAVTALGDGRVAADVVFSRPEGETRTTLVWIRMGGRWLIDEETPSVDQELMPRDVEDFRA